MSVMTQRTNMAPGLGKAFGEGFFGAQEEEADRRALQNAIGGLDKNARPQDVLNAIIGTRASNDSKQQMIKNWMGAAEVELAQNKLAQEQIAATEKKKDEALKEQEKITRERDQIRNIVKNIPGLTDEQRVAMGDELDLASAQAMFKEKLKVNKEDIKKAEEEVSKQTTQKSFDKLVDLIPKVGRSGILTSYAGGETAGSFAEFNSLLGALESNLVEKVNRGTLSNARFRYITETLLPKPSDSQSEIRGKLKALSVVLDLDASLLEGGEKGQGIMKPGQEGQRRSLSQLEIR